MSNKIKHHDYKNTMQNNTKIEQEKEMVQNNKEMNNAEQDKMTSEPTAEQSAAEEKKNASSIDDEFIDMLHLEDYVEGTRYPLKELEEAKKEYKKVYHTYYMGYHFIWHRISRPDFTNILDSFADIEDVKERAQKRMLAICDKCILYPYAERLQELIDNEDIVPRGLADEILDRSGFVPAATKEL